MTALYGGIAQFMISDEYLTRTRSVWHKLFQTCTELHQRFAFGLSSEIRKVVLAEAAKPKSDAPDMNNNTYKCSPSGRGKLRYIGGWCIATLKHRKRQGVRQSLFKTSRRKAADQLDQQVRALEHLTTTQDDLMEKSSDPASLLETARKQNVRQGLCSITDETFQFFEMLDQTIREKETVANINKHGPAFYNIIEKQTLEEDILVSAWQELFPDTVPSADVNQLFHQVVSKFICMSSSQFRREYLRKIKAKKQEAHRKQIRMRKETRGATKGKKVARQSSTKSANAAEEVAPSSPNPKKQKAHRKQIRMRKETTGSTKGKKVARPSSTKSGSATKEVALSSPTPGPSTEQQKGTQSTSIVHDAQTSSRTPRKATKRKLSTPKLSMPTPVVRVSNRTRKVKWPCSVCGKSCMVDSVCCDQCDNWSHYTCVNIKSDHEVEEKWFCQQCNRRRKLEA